MTSNPVPGADESHATGVSSPVLGTILDTLQADPGLAPHERETSLSWCAEADRAGVYTEEPTLAKYLLLHPEFTVQYLRVLERGLFGSRCGPQQYAGETVTGVGGYLPIGALKVSPAARSTAHRSDIVSGKVLENDPREDSDAE